MTASRWSRCKASSTSRPRPNCAARSSKRSTSTPGRPLVVDLEGVDFIDSAGLGVLVGGLKRARDRQGDVLLVASGRNVISVLELTGLTRVFGIHPSRAAALSAGE